MKKTITAALFAVAATMSLPAMATGWMHTTYDKHNYCGGGSSDPSCPTFKFSSGGTASASGTNVTASAWSDVGTGTLSSASLNYYSGSGFGVHSGGESTSSPQHAVDNSGKYEWIMLSFDKAVSLDEITLGWISGDADMTVLASAAPSTSLSGWTFIENLYYTGGSTDDFISRDGMKVAQLDNEVCASYWLIGAINPAFASSNYVGNDFFKLYSVQACVDCGQPGNGVSEPGSLALAGLGLLGVLGLRRRRN
jgi:MYXO-CTERM domain-containing protein